jgi:hypothetical protein
MKIIGILLLIPLTLVKLLSYSLVFILDALMLSPMTFIFIILIIFNKEYFWDKLWIGLIDWLEKYNAFPKY